MEKSTSLYKLYSFNTVDSFMMSGWAVYKMNQISICWMLILSHWKLYKTVEVKSTCERYERFMLKSVHVMSSMKVFFMMDKGPTD